ncbi:MAG: hypothetical protein ACK55Z_11555 [bacterium]
MPPVPARSHVCSPPIKTRKNACPIQGALCRHTLSRTVSFQSG